MGRTEHVEPGTGRAPETTSCERSPQPRNVQQSHEATALGSSSEPDPPQHLFLKKAGIRNR